MAEHRLSGAAGVASGTALISVFSHLGDGALKSTLLLLSPTLTVVVTFFWNSVWEEAKQYVEDRRVLRQIRKQEALVRRLADDPHVPDQVKAEARDALSTLRTLEAQLAKRRVQAIVAGADRKDP